MSRKRTAPDAYATVKLRQVTLPTPAPLPSEEAIAAVLGTEEEKPEPTPTAALATASVKAEIRKAKAAKEAGVTHIYRGEKTSRLSADIPPGLHKALRIRLAHDEKSVSAFIIDALAAMGVVEP